MSNNDFNEIKLRLEHVTEKVLEHLEADKNDHLAVRAKIDAYNRNQEKLSDKVSMLNESMVKVITMLDNLTDKFTVNDAKTEKMDVEFAKLRDKLNQSEKELSKYSTAFSTTVRIAVGIGGFIATIWTIIQMVKSLR